MAESRYPPMAVFFLLYMMLGSCLGGNANGHPFNKCCSDNSTTAQMTCRCPNHRLTITGGVIPDWAKGIHLVDAYVVTIKGNALHSLSSLKELKLKNIKRLVLEANALNLPENSTLQNVYLTNIHRVDVYSGALSGSWGTRAFGMHNITGVNIRQNAVNHSSSLHGPALHMEHIDGLRLAIGALDAQIKQLTMEKVTMNTCYECSFTGDIHNMKMNEVFINDTRKQCISLSDQSTLDIRNSTFNYIRTEGLSGKMKRVKILNSHFSEIQSKGVQLELKHLGIYHSRFGTLETGALNVEARSVYLKNNTIEVLEKRALWDIRTGSRTATAARGPKLTIHGLNVTVAAKEESLALSWNSSANITNIHVNVSNGSMCSSDDLYRWLVGNTSDAILSPAEQGIRSQLKDQSPCPAPSPTPRLAPETTPAPVNGAARVSSGLGAATTTDRTETAPVGESTASADELGSGSETSTVSSSRGGAAALTAAPGWWTRTLIAMVLVWCARRHHHVLV